ncbi:MAG: universal stress protein [Cyclobacteriaceae bacterium]
MEKWIVALDFSNFDNIILKYTSYFSGYLQPKEIHFVNIQKEEDYEYLPLNLLELKRQVYKDRELNLKDKVQQYFPDDDNIKKYFHVLEGSVVYEILNLDNYYRFDLLIMGKKPSQEGMAFSVDRLAKKITSNVLIIPHDAMARLQRILIPIDFSAHAQLAFQVAKKLYLRNTAKIQLLTHHFYKVPFEYTLEHSEHELQQIIEQYARKKMRQFIKRGSRVRDSYSQRGGGDIAVLLANWVRENAIDLVVCGSKGQTKRSLLMLGSNVQKMIYTISGCPLLIIKEPDENKNFFNAMKDEQPAKVLTKNMREERL